MKQYLVSYDIKRNRCEYSKTKIVEAKNLADARKVFDQQYYSGATTLRSVPHPFHITIKLLRTQDDLRR